MLLPNGIKRAFYLPLLPNVTTPRFSRTNTLPRVDSSLSSLRILVIEDEPRFREAISCLLEQQGIGADYAETGANALRAAAANEYQSCIVDLGLPDLDGEEVIRKLRERAPTLPIVVMTIMDSKQKVLGALQAGATGYLLKKDLGTRLISALREAREGGAPLSSGVARLVLDELRASSESRDAPNTSSLSESLTPREIEVLRMFARGLTYDDVAGAHSLSVNTIRTHVRAIYRKLAVSSKTEAVMKAHCLGLTSD